MNVLFKSPLIILYIVQVCVLDPQMEDIRRSGVDRKGLDIPIGIGEDTQIRKAIVDKNARIGRNVLVWKVQEIVIGSQ